MFSEGKDEGFQFDPDWKRIFERDFCKICKNRKECPYDWECEDLKIFIEENENHHGADMDNDNTNDGDL